MKHLMELYSTFISPVDTFCNTFCNNVLYRGRLHGTNVFDKSQVGISKTQLLLRNRTLVERVQSKSERLGKHKPELKQQGNFYE